MYAETTSSPADRTYRVGAAAALGFGVMRPFRRDEKNDFAHLGGLELVKACVAQVILTRGASPDNPVIQGELDWNPAFGSLLHLIRHKSGTLVRQEIARVYVVDALRRWEPRIRVKTVRVGDLPSNPNALLLRVIYDVLSTPRNANQVLFRNVDQTLPLAA